MNKKISLLLIVTILISIFNMSILSVKAGTLGDKKLGIVVDVIDGEALVVKFNNANIFIKLIGVDTSASLEALQYVNTNVKGKYVWVLTESFFDEELADSKFIMAYVYMYDTGEMLNEILLKQGLAQLQTKNMYATNYYDLSENQAYAKSKEIGIWKTDKTKYYHYSGDCTNINTATSSQLTQLKGITSTIASNIISYRKENYFNNIKEIKFVNGMTKKIYDDIYNQITAVTNINIASEKELLTLSNLSQRDVDNIIKYRDRDGKFTDLEQFYRKTDISSSKYNDNRYFISLDYKENIDYNVNNKVVNINTASPSQIRYVSNNIISSSSSERIVDNRKKGYTYKTLMELTNISSISISKSDINKLEDNFNIYTDINIADTYELQSLFGNNYTSSEIDKIKNKRPFNNISEIKDIIGSNKYDDIKDLIYVDSYNENKRININLASKSQLQSLDITSSEVTNLENKYKKMKYSDDLPFNVRNINSAISLYTNINKATENELEALYNMPSSLVSSIISYREDQPFGSTDEIDEFFSDKNERDFYRYIRDFIVVR